MGCDLSDISERNQTNKPGFLQNTHIFAHVCNYSNLSAAFICWYQPIGSKNLPESDILRVQNKRTSRAVWVRLNLTTSTAAGLFQSVDLLKSEFVLEICGADPNNPVPAPNRDRCVILSTIVGSLLFILILLDFVTVSLLEAEEQEEFSNEIRWREDTDEVPPPSKRARNNKQKKEKKKRTSNCELQTIPQTTNPPKWFFFKFNLQVCCKDCSEFIWFLSSCVDWNGQMESALLLCSHLYLIKLPRMMKWF